MKNGGHYRNLKKIIWSINFRRPLAYVKAEGPATGSGSQYIYKGKAKLSRALSKTQSFKLTNPTSHVRLWGNNHETYCFSIQTGAPVKVPLVFKSKSWSERSACAALGCRQKRRWPLLVRAKCVRQRSKLR